MFTTLLTRLAQPSHPRDRLAIAIVARDLRSLLSLSACSLFAGIYGAYTWNSRLGHILAEVTGATLMVGILHAWAAVRRLQREMKFRSTCRRMRFSLPPVLAAGIAAGETMDAHKTAESISVRLGKDRKFSAQSIQVFDCLMHDLLANNPTLSKELRRIARSARKKAQA